MSAKVVGFEEFRRKQSELSHKNHWENKYRSQSKEMLLNELIDQQEKNYPLMKSDAHGRSRFKALVNVLIEKATTPWLKQILQSLREDKAL